MYNYFINKFYSKHIYIQVKAPWVKMFFYGDYDTYIIPGIDFVTLGGNFIKNLFGMIKTSFFFGERLSPIRQF